MASYETKKARIKALLSQQEEIEKELRSLLEPERIAVLPRGFSMSVEVFRLVREAGTEGISSQEILEKMQKQYPDGIDREKVASALAYLKNTRKEIEQAARGVYRAIEKQNA